jgi:hypothetical protein
MDHETSPLSNMKMLEAKQLPSSWTPTSKATLDESHQQ